MKAIILTYAPVSESEQKLLKNTHIAKLAINQHGEEYKPHIRICGDYNLAYIYKNFKQPIISIREHFRYINPRVIPNNLEFKGATIISAVEWLIEMNCDEILIVGDNTVNTKDFQDNVKTQISKLQEHAKIYQYTNGNFDLPVKSISEFLNAVDVGFWNQNGEYKEDYQEIDSKEL